MFSGYLGGAVVLPINVGGNGFNASQAHETPPPYVEPISAAILLLMVGVICGGIGFLKVYLGSSPYNT